MHTIAKIILDFYEISLEWKNDIVTIDETLYVELICEMLKILNSLLRGVWLNFDAWTRCNNATEIWI